MFRDCAGVVVSWAVQSTSKYQVKPAGKPGSVVDSHSSRRFVT
jgi:hypothetical protein